jgi:hypothetical protein
LSSTRQTSGAGALQEHGRPHQRGGGQHDCGLDVEVPVASGPGRQRTEQAVRVCIDDETGGEGRHGNGTPAGRAEPAPAERHLDAGEPDAEQEAVGLLPGVHRILVSVARDPELEHREHERGGDDEQQPRPWRARMAGDAGERDERGGHDRHSEVEARFDVDRPRLTEDHVEVAVAPALREGEDPEHVADRGAVQAGPQHAHPEGQPQRGQEPQRAVHEVTDGRGQGPVEGVGGDERAGGR